MSGLFSHRTRSNRRTMTTSREVPMALRHLTDEQADDAITYIRDVLPAEIDEQLTLADAEHNFERLANTTRQAARLLRELGLYCEAQQKRIDERSAA